MSPPGSAWSVITDAATNVYRCESCYQRIMASLTQKERDEVSKREGKSAELNLISNMTYKDYKIHVNRLCPSLTPRANGNISEHELKIKMREDTAAVLKRIAERDREEEKQQQQQQQPEQKRRPKKKKKKKKNKTDDKVNIGELVNCVLYGSTAEKRKTHARAYNHKWR